MECCLYELATTINIYVLQIRYTSAMSFSAVMITFYILVFLSVVSLLSSLPCSCMRRRKNTIRSSEHNTIYEDDNDDDDDDSTESDLNERYAPLHGMAFPVVATMPPLQPCVIKKYIEYEDIFLTGYPKVNFNSERRLSENRRASIRSSEEMDSQHCRGTL